MDISDLIAIIGMGTITFFLFYFTIKYARKGMRYLQNINLRQDHLYPFVRSLFDLNHQEIIDQTNRLKRSPEKFVKNHPEIFKKYSLYDEEIEDFPFLFKFLLVHHLQIQDNFQVLDWKQSGYEGLDSINYLLQSNEIDEIPATNQEGVKRAVHERFLEPESEDHLSTMDLIIYISRILQQYGSTFVEMNFGGDSYELFLVSTSKVDKIIDLGNKLGVDFWHMK